MLALAMSVLGINALKAEITADFSKEIGPVRRALHSSGYSIHTDLPRKKL